VSAPELLPGDLSWPPRDADHLLVSGTQMAALEQQLFSAGMPVAALMEKTALAVFAALMHDWRAWLRCHGALVLVGPGHNGGDGLVIARELHLAGIETAIWSPFERHKPLTAEHRRLALWLGVMQLQSTPDAAGPALWVDALFGIGQQRPPDEAIAALLAARQRLRPGALVAIDVPTGLDDSSGQRLGPTAAVAAATYTIGLRKQGLVQDAALAAVGRLQRIDLGLPAALLQTLAATTPLGLQANDAGPAQSAWPPLPPAAAKYQRGRVLVIAGSEAYRGAGQLALLGASASGVGSLRAAVPGRLAAALWQLLPHVVLQSELDCSPAGSLLLGTLPDGALSRLDAVLVGPGIGLLEQQELSPGQQAAEQQSWQRLQQFAGLLVLDADGLNRCSAAWLRDRRGPTWITPHRGELDRLWPALQDLPPLEAACRAAADCGAVVLLKGARSVIAAPDGRRWQLLEASAAAARAGLGDVLAGYAAGRGAMALAHRSCCEPCWLAAAALDHALAGLRASAGSATPADVAHWLGQRPWDFAAPDNGTDVEQAARQC